MTSLQDICLLITDGKHGDCQNEESSGYYFVSCKDVQDGWVDYSAARQITEDDYLDTHRRTQLEPSDILITNSGTIGRMALVPDRPETRRTTFQKSVAILKPDRRSVLPRWLYYCLLAKREALISWAGGTAQKNLLLRDLRAFQVEVPSLSKQRKITAILAAYDNLIENNLGRIRLFEATAQLLYWEWFARFRFPGHESARLIDSSLGKIPGGWSVGSLGDLVELRKDKFDARAHAGLPLLDLSRLPRRSLAVGDTGDHEQLKTSRIVFRKGDVLFGAIRPYLHKVVVAPEDGVTNVSVLVLRPKSSFAAAFTSTILFSDRTVAWANQYSTGTKMPVIKWDAFRTMPVVVPPEATLRAFDEAVGPMLELVICLIFKNRCLKRARDLLLPRLMSGEVDVSALDIDIDRGEEAA